HRADLQTDAALLRGARNRHLALAQAVPVLAHGGRLDLCDLGAPAVAHELVDRRHEDRTSVVDDGQQSARWRAPLPMSAGVAGPSGTKADLINCPIAVSNVAHVRGQPFRPCVTTPSPRRETYPDGRSRGPLRQDTRRRAPRLPGLRRGPVRPRLRAR